MYAVTSYENVGSHVMASLFSTRYLIDKFDKLTLGMDAEFSISISSSGIN